MIFMGTPDFAVESLKRLSKVHDISCVFTQPDKPRGRKQIMTPPEVKKEALALNIPVYQYENLKSDEVLSLMKGISPDVIVVAAYGRILPKFLLEIPKYGCINIHASLLPSYRGAAPIQWSVINGDEYTGVTIMQMDEGLDTGDILLQKKIKIELNDTAESMFDKLSVLGAEMIIKALDDIDNLRENRIQQDDSRASYTKMLDKSSAEIDFSLDAFKVHKKICGLYSWPVAYTYVGRKKLKVFKSKISSLSGMPGEVLSLDPLIVGCEKDSIELCEVQLEGKKRMDSKSFVLGNRLQKGMIINQEA